MPRGPVKYSLAVLLVLGCAPAGAVAFAPPPEYAAWWSIAADCVGRARPIETMHFYRTPAPLRCWYANVAGCWVPGRGVYLRTDLATQRVHVVHEMLHVLLRSPWHSGTFKRCEVLAGQEMPP